MEDRAAAVAKVVNEQMAELELTQKELADLSGVSVATIRQVQSGVNRKRSAPVLQALSRALRLPDDALGRVASGRSATDTSEPAVAELAAQLRDMQEALQGLSERVSGLEQASRR